VPRHSDPITHFSYRLTQIKFIIFEIVLRLVFLVFLFQVAPGELGLAQLAQLGHTLSSWQQEIIAMWRFTRNNAITEGFHTKMEVLQRQAYGFRNFQNYRMRVKVLCS
jgi:hypothetical protein